MFPHHQKHGEHRSSHSPDGIQNYYGIDGIARVFGCSVPTANRIKKSGIIDKVITQIGRKIVVDADLALSLVKESGGIRIKE